MSRRKTLCYRWLLLSLLPYVPNGGICDGRGFEVTTGEYLLWYEPSKYEFKHHIRIDQFSYKVLLLAFVLLLFCGNAVFERDSVRLKLTMLYICYNNICLNA